MIKFQTGDIVLIKNISLIPFIIEKITHSKFSHAEVVVSNWGTFELVGADWIGVRGTDLARKLDGKYICVLRSNIWKFEPFTYDDEKALAMRINGKKGIGYDYVALLDQLAYRFTGIWPGRTKEQAEDKFYCSEFAAWVNNLPEFWEYAPEDLYESDKFGKIFEGIYK